MKNKLVILVLLVLGVLSARGQGASTCPYVYMEDDQFMYQGEPFVVKAITYNILFYIQNDTVLYGPDKDVYGWPSTSTYPTNQKDLLNMMNAHFKLISEMGFNTIRTLNWVRYQNFTFNGDDYIGLYIPVWDRYSNYLTGYDTDSVPPIGDDNNYEDYISFDDNMSVFFEAMDTILYLANNYGLKVLWNCGQGNLERGMPQYLNYLDTISKRYCCNSALFAYDFWAEPKEFYNSDTSHNSYILKQRIAELTDDMNVAIKTHDRNHFTTIGTDALWAEFDFGFKSLYCDFVNPHIYDAYYNFYGLPDYATENVLFRDIYWFKNHITDRKWMIGETGLPGGESPELNTPGVYADYAEQKRVTDTVLNFAVACSDMGIAWWQFHDVKWGNLKGAGRWDSYLGIVSSKNQTFIDNLVVGDSNYVSSMYIIGTVKDVGDTVTGSFKTFTTATANCYLDDEDYYNPNDLDTSSVYTGYVLNATTSLPIEGALVTVYKTKHGLFAEDTICANPPNCTIYKMKPRTLSFTGITDENGRYEIHTAYDSIDAFNICAGYYGMTDTCYWHSTPFFDDDPETDINFYIREIPLPAQTTFANETTISASTTWEEGDDRWLSGNLTVASGATLNIYCDVYFLEGKGITINTGGRINLYGKLSSAGNDYLWNGVNILGNSSLSQAYANQGVLIMNSGSTIENANTAVTVRSGGVLKTYTGYFKNNRIGVYFYPYSAASSNVCYFGTTHFLTTRALNGGILPYRFVYMSGINVATINVFSGCRFENSTAGGYANWRGSGIHSYNSSYNISGCTFEGLYYGMYTSSGTIKFANSDFANNYRGLYTAIGTNVQIFNNSFDGNYNFSEPKDESWPSPDYYKASNYSVYVAGNGTNSTLAKFEDNSFYGGTVGSVFYNTGPTALIAKNNSYDSISGLPNACAAIAIGKNSNFIYNNGTYYGQVGLQLRCNEFTRNPYAISIVDGNLRKYQGDQGASQGSQLAGNAFDHYSSNTERDFYVDQVIASSLDISQYTYYNHTDNPHSIIYYTIGSDTLNPKIAIGGYSEVFEESDCDESGGGIIKGMSSEEFVELIEQTDTELILKEFEIEEAIDNGNTLLLLSEAETMNNANSTEVADNISALNGFISDEVAITYMQNNNGNQFAKAGALLSNSPLPASVRDEIDNMDMNPALKQIVKNGQHGINKRNQKETEIANLNQYRSLIVNEMVVSALNNDSVFLEKECVKQFLMNDNNIQSKFQLYNLQMYDKEFQQARATLENINQMIATFDMDYVAEMENFLELQHLLVDIEAGIIDVESAVENNMELLRHIASNDSYYGQVTAQLLLSEAGIEPYYEVIRLPEPIVENKSLKFSTQQNSTSEICTYNDIINVYPNPSSGELFVEYALFGFTGDEFFSIYNETGSLIYRFSLDSPIGFLKYSNKLEPGIYVVRLGENFSKKILVQ